MDIFLLQLVLLFIPGIIWERIDYRFGINRPSTQFDILRRSFCFGLTSYGTLFVLTAALNGGWRVLHPDQPRLVKLVMVTLQKDAYTLDSAPAGEIAAASMLAFALSIGWLYITRYKLPLRVMQRIGATNRFGDEDVWDFTFNSREAEVEYVHVRDFDNKLTYSGWVDKFSETGRTRELVLREVVVTTFDGSASYTTPRLYVARAMDKMMIEFPYVPVQGGNHEAEDTNAAAGQQPADDGA